MKMIITGANSFIGRHLIENIPRREVEILAVVRPGRESLLPESISALPLGMEDYSQLGKIAGACDCFVHLAWMGTRGGARMDGALQKQNVEQSVQAVKSVLAAGCKRVVTAGSQAEYGPHSGIITERSVCRPNTEYGKAKLDFYEQTAELCQQAGAAYKEPRFFSIYGEGDSENAMILKVLRDMCMDRPCKLTKCDQMWDYLHVSDAAKGLCRLCFQPCPDGVYNFASGDIRPLKEYVLEMAQITGTKSALLFDTVPYPKTGAVSLQPDISKLKRELHWKPRITFADGIRSILQAMARGKNTV